MLNYKIQNEEELGIFFNDAISCGHAVLAIKGNPPKGAMYSDGELIKRPVNIAWVNQTTGERVEIVYDLLEN